MIELNPLTRSCHLYGLLAWFFVAAIFVIKRAFTREAVVSHVWIVLIELLTVVERKEKKKKKLHQFVTVLKIKRMNEMNHAKSQLQIQIYYLYQYDFSMLESSLDLFFFAVTFFVFFGFSYIFDSRIAIRVTPFRLVPQLSRFYITSRNI